MTQETKIILPQLCMKRHDLENLPEIVLPPGYTLRTSQAGDSIHWATILQETFGGEEWDEARFERELIRHPAYRPDRIFFVCAPDGRPCATASAYRKASWGENTGYVHFVATRPSHSRKRLGYMASLATLHKFRADGCRDAMLETDDFRTPAIKTYLRLGFRPLVVHESQLARWEAVFAKLGIATPTAEYAYRSGLCRLPL
jgi:mycothiol synthase